MIKVMLFKEEYFCLFKATEKISDFNLVLA